MTLGWVSRAQDIADIRNQKVASAEDVAAPKNEDTDQRYRVRLKRTSDGETHLTDWDATEFWWSDGNGACDCNRETAFAYHDGIVAEDNEDTECSHDRFVIVEWVKADA